MKKFYRLLRYIKPYWLFALLNVVFNLLTIIFSLFSFALLIPFLNLLFGTESLLVEKPEFSVNTESLIASLNYLISSIIVEKGQLQALAFICMVLITAFFFRNLARFMAMYYMAKVRVGSVNKN